MSDVGNAKVHEVAWKFIRRMKSLQHGDGTTRQYNNWRSARNKIEIVIALELMDPNITLGMGLDNQEKDLEQLKKRNYVLAIENEGLREGINGWVQQATSVHRQLNEANKHL